MAGTFIVSARPITRHRSIMMTVTEKRMSEHFGRWLGSSKLRLRVVVLVSIAVIVVYLGLRVLMAPSAVNPLAFSLLFFAEAFTLLTLGLHVFDTWTLRTPHVREHRHPALVTDIAIATFDEDWEILEPTIVGSLRTRGVTHVWVLDDGSRPWLRTRAEALGARYLARTSNEHAKAGNINHALAVIEADLILFLDADHVPQREIVERLSPYFSDPRVAVVQSPHDFRNRDSDQHRGPDTNEQSLFFDVILPGRDRHGAAFWCGSAALMRRQALVLVGGVAVETVSEDLHTTVRLQNSGFIVRCHNERLISGLAPHTLADYILQRDRWARGTLAVLMSRESPLLARGWSVTQRLHYLNSLFYYLLGLQNLAFVASLVLVLGFVVLPVGQLPAWLAALAILNIALISCAGLALGRGRIGLGDGHGNAWLTTEVHLRALADAILRRKARFRVTPKGVHSMSFHELVRILRIPLGVAVLVLVLWLLRSLDTWWEMSGGAGVMPGSLTPFVYVVVTFFVGLELTSLGVVLVRELRRRQRRLEWRFDCRIPATLRGREVTILNLHETGMVCESAEDVVTPGEEVPVRVPLLIDGHVRDCPGQFHLRRSAAISEGRTLYAGSLSWDSPAARRDVIDFCYVHLAGLDHQRSMVPMTGRS